VNRACIQGRLIALLCALAALLAARPAHAQTDARDPQRTAAIQAGIVINFLRYSTWPAGAFDDTEARKAPIVLTILGTSSLQPALTAAARGVTIDGRAIEVRRIEPPRPREGEPPRSDDQRAFLAAIRASHAVFIGESERDSFPHVLAALADAPVLTIAAFPEFAQRGGMLGLTLRARRVAFEANEHAIRRTPLRLSSRLLKLATIVVPETDRPANREDRP
jgi:hypothetical protein